MEPLYNRYAASTGVNHLAHLEDAQRVARHFERYVFPHLSRWKPLPKNGWLEFGSGWGRNILALKTLGISDITGVDISEDQVRTAHALNLPNVHLIKPGVALREVFPSKRFNVILAIDVLEHLSLLDLQRLASSVDQILVPGGLFIAQVPNDLAPLNPVRSGDFTHLRAFTPSSLEQCLAYLGVTPFVIVGMPFPGGGAAFLIRRILQRALLTPTCRAISSVLYGRGKFPLFTEPNLLAVAQRPSS